MSWHGHGAWRIKRKYILAPWEIQTGLQLRIPRRLETLAAGAARTWAGACIGTCFTQPTNSEKSPSGRVSGAAWKWASTHLTDPFTTSLQDFSGCRLFSERSRWESTLYRLLTVAHRHKDLVRCFLKFVVPLSHFGDHLDIAPFRGHLPARMDPVSRLNSTFQHCSPAMS
jgi:hypothetical protein